MHLKPFGGFISCLQSILIPRFLDSLFPIVRLIAVWRKF